MNQLDLLKLAAYSSMGKVNYRNRVTVPIRDTHRDGEIIFLVDIYGVTSSDLLTIGDDDHPWLIGAKPMKKAVRRLGLDPDRYKAWLWDIPVSHIRRGNNS